MRRVFFPLVIWGIVSTATFATLALAQPTKLPCVVSSRATLDQLPASTFLILKRPLALDGRRTEIALTIAIGETVHGNRSWRERFGLECRMRAPSQVPARDFPVGMRFTLIEAAGVDAPWIHLGVESAAPSSVPLRLNCRHYTHTTIATEGQVAGTNFWDYRIPTVADFAVLFSVVLPTTAQP